MKHSFSEKILPIIAISISVLIWGLLFINIKVALLEIPPFTLTFVRFVLEAIIYLILLRRFYKLKFSFGAFMLLIVTSVIGVSLCSALESWGPKFTTASNASVLSSITPIFTAGLGYVFLKYRFDKRYILGIIISVLGSYFIVAPSGKLNFTGGSILGDTLIVASVIAFAIYIFLSDVIKSKYDLPPLAITLIQGTIGTLFILPFSLTELGTIQHISIANSVNLLYMFFASSIAHFLYVYAVKKLGAQFIAVYLNLTPIIGVLGGYLILRETMNIIQFAGAFAVIAGIIIVSTSNSQETQQISETVNHPVPLDI